MRQSYGCVIARLPCHSHPANGRRSWNLGLTYLGDELQKAQSHWVTAMDKLQASALATYAMQLLSPSKRLPFGQPSSRYEITVPIPVAKLAYEANSL